MTTMYCPKCSVENDGDSKFCKRCGYRFAEKDMVISGHQIPGERNSPLQGSYCSGHNGMPSLNDASANQVDHLPDYDMNYNHQKSFRDVIARISGKNSIKSLIAFMLSIFSVVFIIAGTNSRLPMMGILLWLSAIGIAAKDLKDKKKHNDGKGHGLSVIAIAFSIVVLWGYTTGDRNRRMARSSQRTERTSIVASQETKNSDSTQELVDEWQKKGEELVSSFNEQVNVEKIQEQVKEQIQDSIKEQIGEVLSTGKEEEYDEAEKKETDTSSAIVSEGAVTPAFKETMDSYEAFFDEYISFMNKMTSGDAMTSLEYLNYTNFLTKYEETMTALDEMDTDKMSAVDQAYYMEVMMRIEAKLLKVAYSY